MEDKQKKVKPEAIFIDELSSTPTWNKPIAYYKEHCSYLKAFKEAQKRKLFPWILSAILFAVGSITGVMTFFTLNQIPELLRVVLAIFVIVLLLPLGSQLFVKLLFQYVDPLAIELFWYNQGQLCCKKTDCEQWSKNPIPKKSSVRELIINQIDEILQEEVDLKHDSEIIFIEWFR